VKNPLGLQSCPNKKLSDNIKDGISRAIDEIVANPFSGVKLRGELEGRWRWRVGKYRIIYIIDQTPKLVVLLDVGLRKTIYK
jgi:mRNA-degrading endonuclease RelE of RelBE toxin-antitoxin system